MNNRNIQDAALTATAVLKLTFVERVKVLLGAAIDIKIDLFPSVRVPEVYPGPKRINIARPKKPAKLLKIKPDLSSSVVAETLMRKRDWLIGELEGTDRQEGLGMVLLDATKRYFQIRDEVEAKERDLAEIEAQLANARLLEETSAGRVVPR
jgi:hypothetical protein